MSGFPGTIIVSQGATSGHQVYEQSSGVLVGGGTNGADWYANRSLPSPDIVVNTQAELDSAISTSQIIEVASDINWDGLSDQRPAAGCTIFSRNRNRIYWQSHTPNDFNVNTQAMFNCEFDNVTWIGIHFQGQDPFPITETTPQSRGLIGRGNNLIVQNCEFSAFGRAGVDFQGSGNNFTFEHCYFHNIWVYPLVLNQANQTLNVSSCLFEFKWHAIASNNVAGQTYNINGNRVVKLQRPDLSVWDSNDFGGRIFIDVHPPTGGTGVYNVNFNTFEKVNVNPSDPYENPSPVSYAFAIALQSSGNGNYDNATFQNNVMVGGAPVWGPAFTYVDPEATFNSNNFQTGYS